jgi:hypothetical protein
MKKVIVRLFVALVVLAIVAGLAVHLFLDSAIKRGVEVAGPKLTKTDVKVGSVSISLLSGSGAIKNFVLGNPQGFTSPSAIEAASTKLAIKPGSLLSDKVIVDVIELQNPQITVETDMKSLSLNSFNLKRILANLEEATGSKGDEKASSSPPQPEAKAGKKLQVNDFRIVGAKMRVSAMGQTGTMSVPEIHLTNLGTGPEGITAAELAKLVLNELVKQVEPMVVSFVGDVTKGGQFLTKQLGTNTAGTNVTGSLLNAFERGLNKKK